MTMHPEFISPKREPDGFRTFYKSRWGFYFLGLWHGETDSNRNIEAARREGATPLYRLRVYLKEKA